MTKDRLSNPTQDNSGTGTGQKPRIDPLSLVILGAVLALGVFSFLIWQSVNRLQAGMDRRLILIENRLAAAPVSPVRQSRRGIDPNRVYAVNTAGSPAEGPAEAPVTIVEFSDFQ